MTLPTDVQAALTADLDDMVRWNHLLNYFSQNQDTIPLPEKISIYEKCEAFRNFWNTDRKVPYMYKRSDGNIVEMTQIVNSLEIDKKSVNPNTLYTDEELLEHLQTRTLDNPTPEDNNNKPATDSSGDTDSIGEAPALAI